MSSSAGSISHSFYQLKSCIEQTFYTVLSLSTCKQLALGIVEL
jgi:hypothetical protein